METPKRAWSRLAHWYPWSGQATFRLITIGALVLSAFHLHERAKQLEQRERTLQQRIAAFSRQVQEQDGRTRTLLALPAPLEVGTEDSAAKASPSIDSLVRQTDYPQTIQPVALKVRD